MDLINDILWTYILIAMLLGCAVWFTLKTRFVQFRMIGEMVRLLKDSGGKEENGEKHISSFQAFAISLASRVGTGNLAGVATAIAVGGPGAIFWMWIIALLGASSAFVESTLAQLYKEKGKESFIGGPAYYMKKGLKKPWMGILFAILITITFGFAFNSVQSNTICAAVEHALVRAGDGQAALGARDSHIAQAALLLHLLRLADGAGAREQAVLRADKIDLREF